jgi:hypothetical protein
MGVNRRAANQQMLIAVVAERIVVMTAQTNSRVDWAFIIKWIVASDVVLFISSYILGGTLLLGRVLPPAMVIVMAYALLGAVLSTAQGWAMPNFDKPWGRWVLLTTISFASAALMAMLLRMNQTLWYVSIGITSGILQWTMLRRQVRWAGLWIAANTLAWLLVALWEVWGLLLIGSITGVTMMWLLNHSKQPAQSAASSTQVN